MSPILTDTANTTNANRNNNNDMFYLPDDNMMPFFHPLDTIDKPEEKQDWDNLLSNLQLEPDMLQLIKLCKIQEEKRREEETKMKLKEYQVLCQLNFLQSKDINVQLSKSK